MRRWRGWWQMAGWYGVAWSCCQHPKYPLRAGNELCSSCNFIFAELTFCGFVICGFDLYINAAAAWGKGFWWGIVTGIPRCWYQMGLIRSFAKLRYPACLDIYWTPEMRRPIGLCVTKDWPGCGAVWMFSILLPPWNRQLSLEVDVFRRCYVHSQYLLIMLF